ncbi:oligo-1,6-glucosidase [Agromyces flavus]|uniref:Oligo-1,6-glucosidase n=1 Tax=Agromyces flavus TaxID=589382 RepID=A0A1H1ZUU7_9MICO|nr:alpha-glucosidase [Agromyces flavus]MCP2367281.1 oligo-1,6-glucosidase [Agromyces flavus]GGI46042.1 glucohydrolase [Agromyces flavus]SDT37423.1 oligo-1,6-glucosidase [Agromyces flavus]
MSNAAEPRHPSTAPDWWKSAVVYQVYPRSFQDSDGDGVGDLRGILQRLDHLVHLGVDVVWLSPVYRSPQADNGYDISDYQEIDPAFGTLADFDELLAAMHERGLKLVMDLVVNHTSDEHPWFVASRSSRDDPKRDWYWWRPPREGAHGGDPGAEPTNWESFFSGPTWEWDEATGEYYLHLFDRKQPDLNWENPEVRHAVYEMMRWWLDRGVDGFRMDVINLISKHPHLPDGPVRAGRRHGDGGAFYVGGPRLHEFMQEMHREVFDGRDGLITVGETPGVTLDEAILFTDPARREVDMVFQFEHVGLDHGVSKFRPRKLEPGELAASLAKWQVGLHETGWNSLYLENHDQPRSVSRFGDAEVHWYSSATALATMLHLLRGTPYVYQGQELGMTNAPFSVIDEYRDVESLNAYAEEVASGTAVADALSGLSLMSRDHARTPVQWDASPNAGFTTGTPWLAVNPNHDRINAAAQVGDPGSVLEYYRQLIVLRHERPVVAHGDFEAVDAGHPAIFAFERVHDGERLLVVVNLSSVEHVPAFGGDIAAHWATGAGEPGDVPILTNTIPDSPAPFDAPLAPWEARVYASGD